MTQTWKWECEWWGGETEIQTDSRGGYPSFHSAFRALSDHVGTEQGEDGIIVSATVEPEGSQP